MKKLTREDVIIASMPFSDELVNWCNKTPEFKTALKVIYPERFLTLQAVSITYSPNVPEDQVIGIFAYDRKLRKFKQDFIINKGKLNKEFVLYTKLPGPNPNYGKHVKHINEFFIVYAKDGLYKNTHHLTYDELPNNEIKSRATKVINLSNKLDKTGYRSLSDAELRYIYDKILKAKSLDKNDVDLKIT